MMVKATLLSGAIATLVLGSVPMVTAAPVVAQTTEAAPLETMTVTDEQIESFATAYEAIESIQAVTQIAMVAAVESEGLTVEEFNEIAQAQAAPEAEATVSPEQTEQFTAATEQVVALQSAAESEIAAAIQATGLTVDEFEQIFELAQQDPSLQEQIIQRLEPLPAETPAE